jgi:hypothetical protein
MKAFTFFKENRVHRQAAALTLLALLTGCQTNDSASTTLLPAIGPISGASLQPATRGAQGKLVVFTDTFASDSGQIRTLPHRPYIIEDESGKFLRRIENHTSLADETPEAVGLPAGKYRVVGRGTGLGVVEVPVLIVPGDVTMVSLEFPGLSAPQWVDSTNGWVRLANGRVIGKAAVGY